MTNASEIKPEMPVVCSEDGQFAIVDLWKALILLN